MRSPAQHRGQARQEGRGPAPWLSKEDGRAASTVKVRLVKGLRGSQAKHRLSVRALGLRKLNDVRELKDSPQDRGMINKVHYLVACRGVIDHESQYTQARRRRPQGAPSRRSRHRFRPGQDLRPWPQGSFARSGKGKIKAGFEGGQMPMQRRLPKIGFRSKTRRTPPKCCCTSSTSSKPATIDIAALKAAKLVPPNAKKAKIVKKGERHQGLHAQGSAATAGARRRSRRPAARVVGVSGLMAA